MTLPFVNEAKAFFQHEASRVKDFVEVRNPLEDQLKEAETHMGGMQDLIDDLRKQRDTLQLEVETLKHHLEDSDHELYLANNARSNANMQVDRQRRHIHDLEAGLAEATNAAQANAISAEELEFLLGVSKLIADVALSVARAKHELVAEYQAKFEVLYEDVAKLPRAFVRLFNRDLADMLDMFPTVEEVPMFNDIEDDEDLEDEQRVFFDDLKNTPSEGVS